MKHYIIPLFIPHIGCPHRCIFCDQRQITGQQAGITAKDIENKIAEHIAGITREYYVEAAFYGGTFTALPEALQEELIFPAAQAYHAGKIDAIRLSTRPDAIDINTLSRLKGHGVKTIELGAQSFSDDVLWKAGRGHKRKDIFKAAELIKGNGFELGIQLMPGLPGETRETLNQSLDALLQIRPKIVRLYPTVVIKGTPLAKLYEQGQYTPLSIDEAAHIAAVMKLQLEADGIKVIRTGLQSSEGLDNEGTVLAGPYHPAFGELVENEIYWEMVKVLLQGIDFPKKVIVYHSPQETSKFRGIKNRNVIRLQNLLKEAELRVYAAPIGADVLMVDIDGVISVIAKRSLKLRL